MTILKTILAWLGVLLMVVGVGMYSLPASLIVCGALLFFDMNRK